MPNDTVILNALCDVIAFGKDGTCTELVRRGIDPNAAYSLLRDLQHKAQRDFNERMCAR